MDETRSEFGMGFAYNLGLFLAHAERDLRRVEETMGECSMWFSGAADHLYDICDDPEILGEEISEKVKELKKFCFSKRFSLEEGFVATKEDKFCAIALAKDLLLMWDRKCNIPCERGVYE